MLCIDGYATGVSIHENFGEREKTHLLWEKHEHCHNPFMKHSVHDFIHDVKHGLLMSIFPNLCSGRRSCAHVQPSLFRDGDMFRTDCLEYVHKHFFSYLFTVYSSAVILDASKRGVSEQTKNSLENLDVRKTKGLLFLKKREELLCAGSMELWSTRVLILLNHSGMV